MMKKTGIRKSKRTRNPKSLAQHQSITIESFIERKPPNKPKIVRQLPVTSRLFILKSNFSAGKGITEEESVKKDKSTEYANFSAEDEFLYVSPGEGGERGEKSKSVKKRKQGEKSSKFTRYD